MSRLLFDSDALCKLAKMDLIKETISALGYSCTDCVVLPALKYMLLKGRLVESYGKDACTIVLSLICNFSCLEEQDSKFLDCLLQIPDIDPGEAQLFTASIVSDDRTLTGDKRAIRGLKNFNKKNIIGF